MPTIIVRYYMWFAFLLRNTQQTKSEKGNLWTVVKIAYIVIAISVHTLYMPQCLIHDESWNGNHSWKEETSERSEL